MASHTTNVICHIHMLHIMHKGSPPCPRGDACCKEHPPSVWTDKEEEPPRVVPPPTIIAIKKTQTANGICAYHPHCKFADLDCQFLHTDKAPEKTGWCHPFLIGKCQRGMRCLYNHATTLEDCTAAENDFEYKKFKAKGMCKYTRNCEIVRCKRGHPRDERIREEWNMENACRSVLAGVQCEYGRLCRFYHPQTTAEKYLFLSKTL